MPEVGNLADWGKGADLAHLLEFADGDEFRIAAAEWRVEYAARLLVAGEGDLAREELHRASGLWPPIRLQVIDDPRFEGIF